MEAANASTSAAAGVEVAPAMAAAEEAAARAVQKRYEGLLTVRAKALKGKGAWYWAHLEPVLVPSADTGLPKAAKLRCCLCDAVFSASNPSRTASEHLKRGTCTNFAAPPSASTVAVAAPSSSPPIPISSMPPCSSPVAHHHQHHQHHHHSGRKRPSSAGTAASVAHTPDPVSHLALVDPSRFAPSAAPGGDAVYSSAPTPPALHAPYEGFSRALVLSGGKEDLGALAMFEHSVKKFKSPQPSPGPALSKQQAEPALALLSDWLYDSVGAASLSAADHPKFWAFLSLVGLPRLSRRELAGPRLSARFAAAQADADARVRDALFFQLASDCWSSDSQTECGALATLTVNLPNGTSVFHRAVPVLAHAPSDYAEEVLWDAVVDVAHGGDGGVHRCAGIIADRFKFKALQSLESQHHWMVNLSCQVRGFLGLIKGFARELPLFHTVAANCAKVAAFLNNKAPVRRLFHKYQLQELGHGGLLRTLPATEPWVSNFAPVFAMLEDILGSARALQSVVLDESYKLVCLDDPSTRELGELIGDMGFWTNVDAVHSLVKLVKDMAREMEAERLLVGRCLPLWEELRAKVREWCAKFSVDEGPVRKVIDKRFKKNYHPAWSAAFVLDPLHLVKDVSGKYLPPFKRLSSEQEKDVDKLIMRMVSPEEAHIALMELMKWRTEGLDPLYAQAVQVKRLDPTTGKMRVVNPQSSRLVWETHLMSEFKSLGRVAVRLIFLHATACGFKCTPSMVRWLSDRRHSRAGVDRAHKLVFVAANSKLERREFLSDEDKDAELFANGDDEDVLNEPAFADASSV